MRTLTVDDLFHLEQLGRNFGPAFAVSPDGDGIAFVLQRSKANAVQHKWVRLRGNDRADIWLAGPRGIPPVRLTDGHSDGAGFWSPAWSPDGERLAMLSTRGDNATFWKRATASLHQLDRRGVVLDFVRRSFVWLSPRHIHCSLLPAGQRPNLMSGESRAMDAAMQAWPLAREGTIPTSSMLESGTSNLALGQSAAQLFVLDLVDGTSRRIAGGLTEWSMTQVIAVAPDLRLVAFLHEAEAYHLAIVREVQSRAGRWHLVQLRPYRTQDDHIAGVVITFIDITERKQAEAERERLLQAEQTARAELEAALQVRDQFLSIASHELRTPLTPLLSYIHMLRESVSTTEPSQQYHLVKTIERQAQRLNRLIGSLLDVARLQLGQFATDRQPLDLAALVTDVVGDFSLMLPKQDDTHTITLHIGNEPLLVSGDKLRLEEALYNVLNNDVKYSPSGGRIRVRCARTETNAMLEVIDEGVGIPPETQERLFEAFYRAGNTSTSTSGFGLGLYIVQQIMQRHEGRAELDSTVARKVPFVWCYCSTYRHNQSTRQGAHPQHDIH